LDNSATRQTIINKPESNIDTSPSVLLLIIFQGSKMKHFACAAILAVSANVVQAQIGIDCDGAHYPNYDDCESLSTVPLK
jgi:hypothetical protein